MDKTCDECTATFTTRTKSPSRERFCGDKCYRKFWNRITTRRRNPPREIRSRDCAVCGINFTPDRQHPLARTCSVKCSQRRVALALAVERASLCDLSARPCKECGTPFAPTKFTWKWRLYCSSKCAQKVGSRNFVQRHPARVIASSRRGRWNGNWKRALERDGRTCQMCGKTDRLRVHHIDGSGEGDSPNHDLGNLQTLCQKCHSRVHTITYCIIEGKCFVYGEVFKLLGIREVFLDA